MMMGGSNNCGDNYGGVMVIVRVLHVRMSFSLWPESDMLANGVVGLDSTAQK